MKVQVCVLFSRDVVLPSEASDTVDLDRWWSEVQGDDLTHLVCQLCGDKKRALEGRHVGRSGGRTWMV